MSSLSTISTKSKEDESKGAIEIGLFQLANLQLHPPFVQHSCCFSWQTCNYILLLFNIHVGEG